jgi:signal peptidase I
MSPESAPPGRPRSGHGWAGLLVVSSARSYLMFLATLAAMAFLPGLLGWNASVVQSGSMEPKISAGDIVLTSELSDSSPLPIGRVITFLVDDMQVVHRIVSVNEDDSLVTAGDANPQHDPWAPSRDDITGQARLLVPVIGLPSYWLGTGNLPALGLWVFATASALMVVAGALGGRAPRAPGAAAPPARRSRLRLDSRAGKIAAGTTVAALLALALPVLPASTADAAFTGRTKGAASWSVKSYAPISVGAMTGYGAIASVAVRDLSETSADGSTVTGSVATSPGTIVTGFKPKEITGRTDLNTVAAKNAMGSATAVRTALLARDVTQVLSPTLSGTLTGGVYTSTSGAFSVPGVLVLDAKGDPGARFVFRTATTLTTAQRAFVVLLNGAKAENVWWVVGSTASLGTSTTSTDSYVVGTYLVNGNATLRGVAVSGRVVSATGTISVSESALSPTS